MQRDDHQKQLKTIEQLVNVGVVPDEVISAFQILDFGIKNKRFLTAVSLVHVGVKEEAFPVAF